MAQHGAKDTEEKEETKRCTRVQPVHDELELAAQPEDGQEAQALAEMPVTEQVFLVRGPQVFGAQRAKAMLNLQQTHGNRYVQRLAEGSRKATLDEETMRRIEAQKGSGKPLEPKTRSEMEAAFSQDFGGVRIHTDANAGKLARELGAEAFTTGKDVFFKEGASDLGSESGKKLLGHELTHVVQQDLSTVRGGEISKPNEPAEAEAQRVGEAISFDRQPLPIKALAAQVSRQIFGPGLGGPPSVGGLLFGGGGGGGQRAPAQQRQAAKAAEPAKSPEAPTQEEKQRKTLMSMWNAMVVSQLNVALSAVKAEPPDLNKARYTLVNVMNNTLTAADIVKGFNADPSWAKNMMLIREGCITLENMTLVSQGGLKELVKFFNVVIKDADPENVMCTRWGEFSKI